MRTVIGQQGEVRILKLDRLPVMVTKPVAADGQRTIIAHSESGHHHVLTGGDVLERTERVPAGMRIFYAIVKDPAQLLHEAPGAHHAQDLDSGIYEFRISREFDPFAAKARTVAD